MFADRVKVLAFGPVIFLASVAGLSAFAAPAQADQDEILDKAEAAAEQGHLDEALQACRQVLAQDPNSAHALYLVGVIDLERRADQDAKDALLKSVSADPSRVATHIALGKVYLSLREWKPAAEQFRKANDLGDSTGAGHFGMGVALLRQSQYAEALPHLQRAVEINPRDPEWLLALVGGELQTRHFSEARRRATQFARLNSGDAAIYSRLGKLFAEHKMAKDAEDQFGQSAALLEKQAGGPRRDSLLADVELLIARARIDQHDYEGSLESLHSIESIPTAPRTQAAMLHLEGKSLLGKGKLDAGREKLRRAAGADSSSPEYAFDSAWAELLGGEVNAAATAASAAATKWPSNPDIRMLQAVVQRESLPERSRIPLLANWHLKGEGMVCCPCKVPCPCRSNGPSTYGHCESAGAYRITEGHYQHVSLDGLTFVSLHACMGPDNIPSVLYVQPSVTNDKIIALERIFQALNPLRPFVFLSVRRVALSLTLSDDAKAYEAKVPGVIELQIRLMVDGKGLPHLQTAALDRFSNVLEYAQNVVYKVWDDGGQIKWDFSRRQANFRRIDLDALDYTHRTMLIQFADGSGFFTDREIELIRQLKLPTLSNYPRPDQQ